MSKNLSIGLNVVLLIAVAFLYYAHYSSTPGQTDAIVDTVDTATNNTVDTAKTNNAATAFLDTMERPVGVGSVGAAHVAYVNIDKILTDYALVTDLNADLLKEQAGAEARIKKKYSELEAKYVEMEKQARYWTQEQLAKGQQDLQGMQVELQKYEQRLQQELMVKEQDHQTILLRNVKEYLAELSAQRGYDYVITYAEVGSPVLYTNHQYDITGEVLFELNTRYADAMGK